jgi:phospholipase C
MPRPPIALSRREFLRAASAAGVVGCAPRSPGEPGRIDTIVLVMMENRSFDHVFGSRSLVEGLGVDGLTDAMSNLGPDGEAVSPFIADEPCLADPPHGWSSSRVALAGGTNGGFIQACYERYGDTAAARAVMGYQLREHAPVSYALADGYALCDRWFSSVLGPTWPNRMYLHGAQSQGMTGNDLPDGGFYDMLTLWDRLDEVGVPWAYYYSSLPYISLFQRFNTRPELQRIDAFFEAAAAGTLPPVVMVEPMFGINDDHPPANPALGQVFLASIHEALAQSPQWERSLLVITYDEAGGFFDHVAPGTAPDDRADAGFNQLGFRVPTMVAGPWVRPGVSSTPLDHTSVLAYLSRVHGFAPLTARDAAANDLSSLIDAERLAANAPNPPAIVPTVAITEAELDATCRHAANAPSGQPELEAIVPAALDLRPEAAATVRRLFAHAARLGVCDLLAKEFAPRPVLR